jgi:hypothetical protein
LETTHPIEFVNRSKPPHIFEENINIKICRIG